MKNSLPLLPIILAIVLCSCSRNENQIHNDSQDHSHSNTTETFSIEGLVDEVKTVPDSIISYLHAQHHAHKVLERRTVPSGYETKEMKYWTDYAAQLEDLPVINPGPGEYVHVMEGYKNAIKIL